MNTRTSILYIIFSFIFLTNMSTGSDHAQGDMHTPQRDTLQVQAAVAETPSQLVAKKHPEVFNYMRLKSILGDPFVTAAKLQCEVTDETLIENAWNSIFNPLTPYNEHRKRQAIRKIPTLLLEYTGERDLIYLTLSDEISRLDTETKRVPLTRVEESTKGYFEKKFRESKVTTSWKRGGDQLGCVAEADLRNGQVLTYYVKTHSGGLRSGHSSAAKLVDPSELLVYKVLEGLGIAPQSHFFGRDGENLYIATLSADMHLDTNGELFKFPFYEYSYFKDSKNTEVQAKLWGALSQLPTDVSFSDTQHQQAEMLVNSDEGIARNFVREVATLDLVARIMRLTDFQTNPGNYGFIEMKDGVMKAKAIDFRINSTDPNEIRFAEHFFEGFLRGNGCFNYSSTGAEMYYALYKRQQTIRAQEANYIMSNSLKCFEKIVDEGQTKVLQALEKITMSADDKERTQTNLDQYASIIKDNFLRFKDKLANFAL